MWEEIIINTQNIVAETDKAVLIKAPHKSIYDGFSFWHPKKLVKDAGGKGFFKKVVFNTDNTFCLKKYGNGKFNRTQVLEEISISSLEFKAAFENEAIQKDSEQSNASYVKVDEPSKVQTSPKEVDECLINKKRRTQK